jgi:hypothetical protein
MEIPVQRGSLRLSALAAGILCSLLGACAAGPRIHESTDLERRPPQFSLGRVTVILTDELGMTLSGLRVDMSWDEPNFHRTSAFTNRQGEVTFSGVPEVAEVSVNHPGGIYNTILLVPQSGRPELRVMLDTQGGGELMRQQERERLMPRGMRTSGSP